MEVNANLIVRAINSGVNTIVFTYLTPLILRDYGCLLIGEDNNIIFITQIKYLNVLNIHSHYNSNIVILFYK